ncbi:MAG: bifunctional oligoribonuclease/PAP phosphatase NrnA [Clostridia bacterium]
MIDDLIIAINKAESIAIISHINPDGDTCSSALALFRAFALIGKKPFVFCENDIKETLLAIDGAENYNKGDDSTKFDLAIACDCADISRLGKMNYLFSRARVTANVDHHQTNSSFGNINILERGASATCEIIFKIIKEMDKQIAPCFDDIIAKLLYTGIVTDSGGFTFSSVSSQTHAIASELKKYNFDAALICEYFMKNIPMKKFLLKNIVLSNARFFENDTVGIIYFTQSAFEQTGTNEDFTDGIINNIRNIDGVEVAIAITELPSQNSFKVSIRTSDNVSASEIASIFGGGGHKNAAGCRLNGFYEDVKEKLLKATRDCI